MTMRKNSLTKRLAALLPGVFVLFGAQAAEQKPSEDTQIQVKQLAEGLANPWGMTFLPDGNMLITERAGDIRRYSFDQGLGKPLTNVPKVDAVNQGGMLDVVLDPEFADNQTIYFCYAKAGDKGRSSAVSKATLKNDSLSNVETIFVAEPLVDNGFHFGCRLAFDSEQHLYVSLGDRNKYMDEAQNTDNHFGKVVRINKDGSVPESNPFVDGNAPEIFTYGHRNVQGLTVHPQTGEIWAMEHGPRGGDEVNVLNKGNNYGWPVITHGIDYDGSVISDKTHQEGMEQPWVYWDPSIAPSGMAFYTGEAFKDWEGDLLVGSLKFTHLRRIDIEDGKPGEQHEYLRDNSARIRDVEVGPDGFIYLLTDAPDGKLLQLSPAN